jgi:SAM-dependent methyltransferase
VVASGSDSGEASRSKRDDGRPERRAKSQRFSGSHERGDAYDERWKSLAASGVDVHGEANLVDALVRERGGRRVLDAGCGTGRVAIELAQRGFDVVGVDIDPTMLDTARRKAPALRWLRADLAHLDLGETFDAAVLAGNVMLFIGAGHEGAVLAQIAAHLVDGGLLIAGFQLDTGRYALADFDTDATAAGLALQNRYATWEQAPFDGGSFAVSVLARS